MKKIRNVNERVKTAKGRKMASKLWLERQLNDVYVKQAKAEGYRSRAAYKLIEMNEKFKFLQRGKKVLDLGAAPGGWSQVASAKGCEVTAIDLLEIDPIPNVNILQGDFYDFGIEPTPNPSLREGSKDSFPSIRERSTSVTLPPEGGVGGGLGGPFDIIMSDMAPNTTGNKLADHLQIISLVEAAYEFALEKLNKKGVFVTKIFQGAEEQAMVKEMRKKFDSVKYVKPESSRVGSKEIFILAMGYKG